ncbi:MAG: hypothetical protein ACRDQY_00905 [Pseudonocardiaceae bacterium]
MAIAVSRLVGGTVRYRTFLTQGALDFLEQEVATLDGLEEVRVVSTVPILPPAGPPNPKIEIASDQRAKGTEAQ